MGKGSLTVKVGAGYDALPINGANVVIKDDNGSVLYNLKTDMSGRTETVSLYAPDKANTLNPDYTGATYSTYRVEVSSPGLVSEVINGVQIFDTIESLEEVTMHPYVKGEGAAHTVDIPPHEQVLRDQRNQVGATSSRVLQRVIIPDFITVHLGRYNVSARNIRVPFPAYIKNVASSEIYPTWPGF